MRIIEPVLSSDAARTFWEGCSRKQLLMPRCTGCRRVRWYLQVSCPNCHTFEATWEPVSGRGTIYTYTVVHRAFHEVLADWVPFVSILVTLDECEGSRFVSRLVDCEPQEVRVGLPVEVHFRQAQSGVMLPFFRPVAVQ